MIDEETFHMRAREIASRASSFRSEAGKRSTTDGSKIIVGTTEGDPSTDVVGSGKPDHPTF